MINTKWNNFSVPGRFIDAFTYSLSFSPHMASGRVIGFLLVLPGDWLIDLLTQTQKWLSVPIPTIVNECHVEYFYHTASFNVHINLIRNSHHHFAFEETDNLRKRCTTMSTAKVEPGSKPRSFWLKSQGSFSPHCAVFVRSEGTFSFAHH